VTIIKVYSESSCPIQSVRETYSPTECRRFSLTINIFGHSDARPGWRWALFVACQFLRVEMRRRSLLLMR